MATQHRFLTALLLLGILSSSSANCEEGGSFSIEFRAGRFVPEHLEVPTDKQVALTVKNSGSEEIEFESFKLNREITIAPGESKVIYLPALAAGSYDFYDDFHKDVPEGEITAK